MQLPQHSITALFDQLGLESSDEAIEQFIKTTGPLPADQPLYQADCWNASQSAFLKNMIDEDADWAEVVDQLNARLHK